jgi:hypothetical protein
MKPKLILLVIIAALALGIAFRAQADSYTFTKIADSSGPLSCCLGAPVLNDHGTAAFWGGYDGGGEGIFAGSGGALTTIADTRGTNGNYEFLRYSPSINTQGDVALWATQRETLQSGVYTGNGGAVNTLYDSSGSFRSFGSPVINDSGTVGFKAGFDNDSGVFKGDGGPATTIAETGGDMRYMSPKPDINNQGTMAFKAEAHTWNYPPGWVDYEGIYTGSGGTVTNLADTRGEFAKLGDPSINNYGAVAFNADLDSGGKGIFLGKNGQIVNLADLNDGFRFFGDASINDAETVAFLAGLAQGGEGVFVTSPDGTIQKVIGTGDTLFDRTVKELCFFRGLNNNDEVAFLARLDDGECNVVVAKVPEPGTMMLLFVGMCGLVMIRYRGQGIWHMGGAGRKA